MTAYLLSASVFTPILGRVGDMFGKQRLLVVVLVVFGIGSAVAAIAPTIGVMIVGRLLAGAGGAVIPLSFGIVRDEAPPDRVAPSIGLLAALLGVGSAVGITLTGPIVDLLNYHWLFWITMAIALGVAASAHRFIPASTVRAPGQINWLGAACLSGWLVALLLGVSEAPEWGWAAPKFFALVGLACVLALAWVLAEGRAANPLIDMRMMRQPIVWRVNVISLLYGIVLYSLGAFLPLYVQAPRSTGYGFGVSITESGLMLLPSGCGMFLFGVMAAGLARRFGSRPIVFVGSALAIVPFALLALPVHEIALPYLASAFSGAGFGLAFSTMANIVVRAVPPGQTGVANAMNTNFRGIGGAVGTAVVSSLITAHLQADGYPTQAGYTTGWIVLASGAALATAMTLTLPGRAAVPARAIESATVGLERAS